MENCVAPGLDEFDVLLEVVLSLVRVGGMLSCLVLTSTKNENTNRFR